MISVNFEMVNNINTLVQTITYLEASLVHLNPMNLAYEIIQDEIKKYKEQLENYIVKERVGDVFKDVVNEEKVGIDPFEQFKGE